MSNKNTNYLFYEVRLERIPDYPNDELNIRICFFVSGYSFNVCACAKKNTWNPNCNKIAVNKCLVPCYQLFWLVKCTTICTHTNAACINIHCSSSHQKGDVILYILVQTSPCFTSIFQIPNRYWIQIVKNRIRSSSIMREYGSTLYAGMVWKKWLPINYRWWAKISASTRSTSMKN